jgi:replicative DNA helicase
MSKHNTQQDQHSRNSKDFNDYVAEKVPMGMQTNYKRNFMNEVKTKNPMATENSLSILSSVDIEVEVLGSLMIAPQTWELISEFSPSEDLFILETHKIIFNAIATLHKQNRGADLLCVTKYLDEQGQLNKVGSYAQLARIVDTVLTTVNITIHVKKLVELKEKRSVASISQTLFQKVIDNQHSDISALINWGQKALEGVSLYQEQDLIPIKSAVDSALDAILKIQEHGKPIGVASGFYDLDKLFNGFKGGELVTIAGRPGMGKSAFALNLAKNSALEDKSVAYYSLEMSIEQIGMRLLASESNINLNQMTCGYLPQEAIDVLKDANEKISSLPLSINSGRNMGGITVSIIKAQLKKLQKDYKLDCVVIDYLQLLTTETPNNNKVQEITQISRDLKLLALELDIPVLVLSQLNRAVEQRNNKRPMLSDLRDSGAIEQDSDAVIMLYRDDYYDPLSEDKGLVEINVVKNRNGALGQCKLIFEKEFSVFKNYANSHG